LCDLPADFVDRAGFPVQAPQDNSFNELVIFERIQAKPLYIVKSLPQQLDCLKKYITDTWKADPVMVRHFQTKMDKLLLKSTPFQTQTVAQAKTLFSVCAHVSCYSFNKDRSRNSPNPFSIWQFARITKLPPP